MKVEVLYLDGCPNHEALLPRLQALLSASGVTADIELVPIGDAAAAERERFVGSPTVRVDGEDIEPGAADRTDYGLKCRLFATPDGLRGLPAEEWVLAALQRVRQQVAGATRWHPCLSGPRAATTGHLTSADGYGTPGGSGSPRAVSQPR